jgi:hypothetical protein
MLFEERLGGEERRLMHLVPAPAVRLMKRRVLSRPGVTQFDVFSAWSISLIPVMNGVSVAAAPAVASRVTATMKQAQEMVNHGLMPKARDAGEERRKTWSVRISRL